MLRQLFNVLNGMMLLRSPASPDRCGIVVGAELAEQAPPSSESCGVTSTMPAQNGRLAQKRAILLQVIAKIRETQRVEKNR